MLISRCAILTFFIELGPIYNTKWFQEKYYRTVNMMNTKPLYNISTTSAQCF